jgi:hypothetical protein
MAVREAARGRPHSEWQPPPAFPGTRFRLRAADIQLYRACEELTQWLLYAMVVFSPWAFGTTQPWSVWTMNIAGYCLGLLLSIKLALRWWKGYRPSRWDDAGPGAGHCASGTDRLTIALAAGTTAVLAYILIAALNARATARFDGSTVTFEYHKSISWLPHSLDSAATWNAFWICLALACAFWSARDWILGKSDEEQLAGPRQVESIESDAVAPFPVRLRRLLWVMAINGALLGVEAIVQRVEASPKLLFLVQPRIHQTAETQFGPFAYRSNAAQYFNLLWPVCLGFWWTYHRVGSTRSRHHLLLIGAVIMAACPIISTSRGGAFVAATMAAIAAFVLAVPAFCIRERYGHCAGSVALRGLALFFSAVLLLGASLGWRALAPRLAQLDDGIATRQSLYDAARPIADDYPLFGTGPGTFETVSYLYPRPDVYWPPQLHNDWLETRITFGWIGSALIAFVFLLVIARWFSPGGIHGSRRFVVLGWLSLAGCLAHARYDFPFQIYSVLFVFVLLCAVLSTLSPRHLQIQFNHR